MEAFDLSSTPLRPGITLIEASAGTGKTFTITGLILRFILEQRRPLREMLAVTFTNAATAELRDRVRKRLQEALGALRADATEDQIIAPFLRDGGDRAQAMRDLDLAVQSFDEAQIFTIHGFCQRVLRENAFESGLPFDLELSTDTGPLFKELRQDFWRAHFYPATPLRARIEQAAGLSIDSWSELLKQSTTHPQLKVRPPAGPLSVQTLGGELEECFAAIQAAWTAARARISELLTHSKSLGRSEKTALRDHEVPEHLARMDRLASEPPDALPPQTWQVLEVLSQSGIHKRTQPSKPPITDPFFALCEEFTARQELFLQQLNHEFLAYARATLPRIKQRHGVQTYDDLLQQLHRVLTSENGGALATTLRRQYGVALIDEFQDTDPIQYEIFRRLFAVDSHHLYHIGDPKQAIYSFRGADIFTYLAAKESATRCFTLTRNFRSEAPLLTAFNTLFSHVAEPFRRADISYHALQCGLGASRWTGDENPARLRLRWLRAEGAPWNQNDAADLVSEAVVNDLERLLASGSQLDGRPLRCGDVAILTRINAQATSLQNRLRARDIKSVLQTEASVFSTMEARAVLRLCRAVCEPARDPLLRAALSTSLIGLAAAEIHALGEDTAAHQTWLEHFLTLRAVWEKSGFIAMFRAALVRFESRRKLVIRPDGERQLTNYLHLSELLHEAEAAERLAPEALCAWLSARFDGGLRQDSYQLRLESDEDAVTLLTIHKSKGLEFPIVFCPFAWKPSTLKKDPALLFHDPETKELIYDVRSAKAAPVAAQECLSEQQQEDQRLLYVAVTRAQHCVYLYAGEIQKFEHSPLAHLLGGVTADAMIGKSGGTISQEDIVGETTTAALSPTPSAPSETRLEAHAFSTAISRQRMITSFTALTTNQLVEGPEHDDERAEEPLETSTGALSPLGDFERGARAGVFFHELLEKLNFQKPQNFPAAAARYLGLHGYPARRWSEPISQQLTALMELELAPGLRLMDLSAADRRSELEFTHPISALKVADLPRIFAAHQCAAMPARLPEMLGRLRFDPVEGWLRGVMDLLFQHEGRYYLVDWKSNWLGAHLADYEAPALEDYMTQKSFHLQYHLYTVATDLFLRQQLRGYDYATHFGGVFYIFLRGVDAGNSARGVYRARPDAALIHDLGAFFTGNQR